MNIQITVIDVFTDKAFSGNPAACVLTAQPLDENLMQNIALEMNLSETAFAVPLKNKSDGKKNEFQLRWFTPAREVPLCGHATLAMAHYLKNKLNLNDEILFHTLSGAIGMTFKDEEIIMNFPSAPLNLIADDLGDLNDWMESIVLTDEFKILGEANQFLFVELENEEAVKNLNPLIHHLKELPYQAVCFSALSEKNTEIDYVCRLFAPALGIDEDPVTGAAHTVIGSHYAAQLNKTLVVGKQWSKRTGIVKVKPQGLRADLIGKAVMMYQAEMIFS